MIGIISYYPDNEELKGIRKKNHKLQLQWLNELFPNEEIVVVAQNYKIDDYAPNIGYIKYDEPIGPGKARNVLLQRFYNSDDDVLFMMDDDVVIYDYYDIETFLKDYYYNFSKYECLNMDMIVPLMPELEPFKKVNYEKYDTMNNYVFKRTSPNCCPNQMMLKNINKYYGCKIFYNEDALNDTSSISEDIQFICKFLYEGLSIYKCMHWIKKSLNRDKSVIFEGASKKDNYSQHNKLLSNLNLFIWSHYKCDMKQFNKLYNISLEYLAVKRDVKYIIPDNLKPTYKSKSNLLF